jgi:acetyl-CoA carboxylase biotin carboxyl carrier protein
MAMEFKDIQELVKLVNRTNIAELRIKEGDFEVLLRSREYVEATKTRYIGTPATAAPMHHAAPAPAATPSSQSAHAPQTQAAPAEQKPDTSAPASAEGGSQVIMKSPMIGTFYRSPGPDKEAFVKVGDVVQKGDVVCIIEAMKLFNEIEAEFSGKIIKVLAEDSSPVEYDQPLFLIDTSA